jgi:UDP-glucuronate 4-epimerase
MKILVTGTAGFIGYHLAKKLLERGDEVVGLDNINDYYDVNLKYARLSELGIEIPNQVGNDSCEVGNDDMSSSDLTSPSSSGLSSPSSSGLTRGSLVLSTKYKNHRFYKADLADTETINNIFKTENFDAVVNLAAQAGVRYSLENPHAYIQSNIVGFMNILEACRNYNVKNLAYASSSSVYGLNKEQPFKTTDKTDTPVSLYAATKKSNELMAHTYSHLYGIQTTGLRFFTVYGPWGRPDMAPMLFASAISEDRPIKVFNHGKMSRDFTYIDDIVDGIVKVIDSHEIPNQVGNDEVSVGNDNMSSSGLTSTVIPDSDRESKNNPPYNIGNNSPLSLMEFIETIEDKMDKKAQKNYMEMQPGDVESTYADTQDLIDDFGYKPDTKLADGIEEFVKWYKEFYGKGQ